MDAEFWDKIYGSREAIWSDRPNVTLVAEAGALTPGRALDVGCGEGADALWLAQRGWRVTAVDVSHVAVARAAARALRTTDNRAHEVVWQQADLTQWSPPALAFDLVSIHYFHIPRAAREAAMQRLVSAVAFGGTLLVVGHHPDDVKRRPGCVPDSSLYFTAEEVASLLEPDGWLIEVKEARERTTRAHDGSQRSVVDAVLRARRFASPAESTPRQRL